MKNVLKLSLFASFFILFLGLESCVFKDEHYTNVDTWVQEYRVGRNQWRQNGDVFECNFSVRELTRDMYENGMLNAYIVYPVNNVMVDSPLPYTDFFINNGHQFSYQYTCEFSPGRITFLCKISDFFMEVPDECLFVVKMMR
ncbi:MAG: hypothetical protein LBI82_06325 [Dysgonamonadaceae bacterium]|nr:hypothetical protein [Dysgonamonadaceae bacterium]